MKTSLVNYIELHLQQLDSYYKFITFQSVDEMFLCDHLNELC